MLKQRLKIPNRFPYKIRVVSKAQSLTVVSSSIVLLSAITRACRVPDERPSVFAFAELTAIAPSYCSRFLLRFPFPFRGSMSFFHYFTTSGRNKRLAPFGSPSSSSWVGSRVATRVARNVAVGVGGIHTTVGVGVVVSVAVVVGEGLEVGVSVGVDVFGSPVSLLVGVARV